MATKKTYLTQAISLIKAKSDQPLTPEEFILGAIHQWGEMDLFFRAFDPKLLPGLTAGGLNDGEYAIFKQNDTDHYFGMPISGTVLLERLGIYSKPNYAGYATNISAILMLKLDSLGYEYFGIMHAPIARMENGAPVAEPRRFNIDSSRLDSVLRTKTYIGYTMTDVFKGATLLIPEDILIPAPFKGEADNA
jgi:hypothetical protein